MPYTHKVPSAQKLIGAILIAILAFMSSEMFKPLMPPETSFGSFTLVNIGLGIYCGWSILGNRAGEGFSGAIGGGLTAMASVVAWCLVIQSINEMIAESLERAYGGPMEAIIGVFEIGLEFGQYLADVPLIVFMVVGAMICGFVVELVARRTAYKVDERDYIR